MHESLFASCIRGAHTVLGLARKALADAAGRRGKDAPLSYPGTAYELPVVLFLCQALGRALAPNESLRTPTP